MKTWALMVGVLVMAAGLLEGVVMDQQQAEATGRPTVVTFVLDETGSMMSIKDDTIGGFNQYLASLKKKKPGQGPVEFSLIKFDSNRVQKVHVGEPVENVEPLNDDTYQPGAMTPLIDASYKAIVATSKAVDLRAEKPIVLVVIQTDGLENASTEHTRDELAALVKEKTAEGWAFVFLGAGIDAFAQAGQLGISASHTATYSRTKSGAAFGSLLQNTDSYRLTGEAAVMGFTATQRGDMGGGPPPPEALKPQPAPPAAAKPGPIVDDIDLGKTD